MALTLSKRAQAVKPSSTLAITAKAKELRAQGIDVVGFVAGEPDFNTPDNINKAAIAAIDAGFTKYTPVSGTLELKQAVAKKFAEFNHLTYTPEQIVISNGGKHSLTNAIMAITNPGDEFLLPAPYWLSYPEMIRLADGVPVPVRTQRSNDYKVTVGELEAACTDKTKALILNTPNNPTGSVYTEEELKEIADFVVRKDIYVIADEMYEYLIYDGREHVSIARFNDEIYKRTITCSGLSKSYAMTGWRIGYAAAPVEIAKLMSSVQSHQASNPNSIAQKAAFEALSGPQDAVNAMVKEFEKRNTYLYEAVNKLPYLDCIKPEGAFYAFVDCSALIGKKYKGKELGNAADISQALIDDYMVAVISCDDFGIENHLRLSYAISMHQIEEGIKRIGDFLNTLE